MPTEPGKPATPVLDPLEIAAHENTNGLLREYFPKGTDITDNQTYLDHVAVELNNRPRRTLGY